MIYPQRFKGHYRNLKNFVSFIIIFLYLTIPWISYEREGSLSDQGLFFDLPGRKAYIFNIIIWPDELYYLTFILILAALGLFIATSLFGRIWCGYTCPNTIMVDLFIWAENFFQGDRNHRIKLDSQPMTGNKFIKKLLTHITWIVFSFIFALGWVSYFYEARTLIEDLKNFSVTTNGLLWLIGLTISTYLFAGFMREKVCTDICPYGRFQSALTDQESLVVTYHDWRGEPRGKGGGDCIDCNRCYIACPMGIDIRNGLQISCISCGLCIDACDEVMVKTGKEIGLIDYSSLKSTEIQRGLWPQKVTKSLLLSSKLLIYSVVFSLAFISLVVALINKETILLQVEKDASPLFIRKADGSISNSYNLLITNKTIKTLKGLCLKIEGLDSAKIQFQGKETLCHDLEAGANLESKIIVSIDYETSLLLKEKFIPIKFLLLSSSEPSLFYLKK
jgi:cytochrome c oxidase accessory protein FixG